MTILMAGFYWVQEQRRPTLGTMTADPATARASPSP
jgi:hypothetical protein